MSTAAVAKYMLQAKAEQAFWSAKNPRLQIEPCDCLNGRLTRLHHQRQRDSFWRDITSHAVNFEKILTPLEDRINEVNRIDLGSSKQLLGFS